MPEPLDSILAALIGEEYRISDHVWENFVLEDDRPDPEDIVRAIMEDDPQVESHDRNNPRGSSCDVNVVDANGRAMLVTIGYADRPIVIVTAYFRNRGTADEAEEGSPRQQDWQHDS